MEKTFDQWDWETLMRTFGLKRMEELPLLTEWTNSQTTFDETEFSQLKSIRKEALLRGNDINEDEVKMFLIAPLLKLAKFPNEPYSGFTQRPMSAVIGEYELSGRVDYVLATGIRAPREPFFFIQEYKPAQLRNSDPLGQVLVALLVAQHNNGEEHAHPLLGASVFATTWNFVVLEGKNFAVSPGYDITTDAVFQIPAILRAVNGYVEQWLK